MAESSRAKRDRSGSRSTSERTTANILSPTPKAIALPAGLRLLHTFTNEVFVAWSPDGKLLASSHGNEVRLWDSGSGRLLHTFKGKFLTWSPDSKLLGLKLEDKEGVLFWDLSRGERRHTLKMPSTVTWSPDGKLLASSHGNEVRLWNSGSGRLLCTFKGKFLTWLPDSKLLGLDVDKGIPFFWDPTSRKQQHLLTDDRLFGDDIDRALLSPDGKWLALVEIQHDCEDVYLWNLVSGKKYTFPPEVEQRYSVAWSPDGKLLTFASSFRMFGSLPYVGIWDPTNARLLHELESHKNYGMRLDWSPDGKLLAVSDHLYDFASDGLYPAAAAREVRIWRTDTWEPVVDLPGISLAWHPYLARMATSDTQGGFSIWDLDLRHLLRVIPSTEIVHYTNAKVVLVGDSGVGKTGLALVLTNQPFVPTDSTHGRHVWLLDRQEVQQGGEPRETREVLLWDLAGQRDYRLIHQLHLHEATVALIVFDAARDTDPFAGIRHWHHALRQAQQAHGSAALPLTIFLVAARIDGGGGSVSRARIEALLKELDCAGYIETSAKDGRGTAELGQTIRTAIDWSKLPNVTSTTLLQSMKTFVLSEQQAGRLLRTIDELYDAFLRTDGAPPQQNAFRQQFETALGRLEAQGALRQLGFGQLILLQPELLDAYASALLIAIKKELDGLGSIAEVRVQQGDFPVPTEDRLTNSAQEKLLLIAMIEELVRHQLVLRESGFLLFPSQSTREHPEQNSLEEKSLVTFTFVGPVLSIYTTLVVRLAQSAIFQKLYFWQHVVTYTTRLGGTYGLVLSPQGEERADLGLFFDEASREEMRFHFEDFVHTHLDRHASTSLRRHRHFVCATCGFVVTEQLHKLLSQQGSRQCACPVCHSTISLLDGAERLSTAAPSLVKTMEQAADVQRDRESAASILQGKIATQDFDVFLCHHGQDKGVVKQMGEQLKQYGILPWLDEWELRPGLPWQQLLEQQIEHIKAAAVFIGKSGIGPWQHQELDAFLREFVQRGCPVIPVLLPDAPQEPILPVFLRAMTWVDFRSQNPDPMQRLLWGITGKREMSEGRREG